jgi:hypothetical protein
MNKYDGQKYFDDSMHVKEGFITYKLMFDSIVVYLTYKEPLILSLKKYSNIQSVGDIDIVAFQIVGYDGDETIKTLRKYGFETLDYITGASFLGMVAKNYNDFENSFKVFHSANVRFGEATPLFENKPTYKVPFCFFHPKLDENKKEVKNNHFIKYEDEIELNKQYKQVRSGYITSNLDYINLDYVYSQKAAYDKTNRKSKDSFMFGYKAIKKGATWKFSIKFDDLDEKIENQVIENILGEKYLGKSKTSQYGKVLIEVKDIKCLCISKIIRQLTESQPEVHLS